VASVGNASGDTAASLGAPDAGGDAQRARSVRVAAAGTSQRKRLAAASVALAAALCAAALAYGPAIDGGFHFDDYGNILENWSIRDLDRVLRDVRPLQLLGPDRPVTTATFALDYARGRLDPSTYHLTSLAIHLATAILVFLLAMGALRRAASPNAPWIAAAASAAFALHPLQTESVAFAAQRSEVLAAALGLGALLALVESGRRRSRAVVLGLVAAATMLHLLALGAKAVAVAVPAAFIVHRLVLPDEDALPFGARLSRAMTLSAPLWLLSAATVVRNLVVLGPGDTAGIHAGTLGPWRYLLTQLRVHWLYARLVLWPAGQNVEHAMDGSPGLLHLPTAVALLATVGVLAGVIALWRLAERGRVEGSARVAAFGVLLFLVALTPSSSIVPIDDVVAEHRAYLASAGLLITVFTAGDALLRGMFRGEPGRIRALLAAAVLAALGGALHARARVWSSDHTLWTDAVEKNPSSARAWANLGRAHDARGNSARAFEAYRRAEALAHRPADVATTAANLSAWYGERGEFERALATAARGLAVAPRDPPLHHNRAAALWKLGQLAEARMAARRANELSGGRYPTAQRLLGLILWDEGDARGALEAFHEARRLDPDTPVFAEQEFVALARLGRAAAACGGWTAIVKAGWLFRMEAGSREIAASLGCR